MDIESLQIPEGVDFSKIIAFDPKLGQISILKSFDSRLVN
jgi:hypothetical protein